MTRTVTAQLAQAVLIVCIGGIVIANINFKFMPAHKPYYAVMAAQRAEKLAVTPPANQPSANDSNSRTNPQ